VCCVLCVACCVLRVACCVLRVVWGVCLVSCVLHVACVVYCVGCVCCVLCAACCVLCVNQARERRSSVGAIIQNELHRGAYVKENVLQRVL